MSKIYKYMGPDILELSLIRDGYIGFKCSFPKDYNDPYELFLSIDRSLEPQYLAFYQESIGEIPQIPTTCFSRSPVVVPMWAHYAHTSRGFVIEIDEETLLNNFDDISIGNVIYTDIPNENITPSLQRAYMTRKPRHTFWLHKLLMGSAYFSKQTCWSYEKECRVLVPSSLIENINGNMIFYVPSDCITSIITGSKVQSEYFEKARNATSNIGCKLFRSFIGKSYPSLYIKDENEIVHIFNNGEIEEATKICSTCNEPLSKDTETDKCSWCAIDEFHRQNAAESNPYRLLQAVGRLKEHVQVMENIYRGKS